MSKNSENHNNQSIKENHQQNSNYEKLFKIFKTIYQISQSDQQQKIDQSIHLSLDQLYKLKYEQMKKLSSQNQKNIHQNLKSQQQSSVLLQNIKFISILALSYYAIAKITQQYQPIQKAINLLTISHFPVQIQILWKLQSAAILSSLKKHQIAYNHAIDIIQKSINLLNIIKTKYQHQSHSYIIQSVINEYISNDQMTPILFYNKNHHLHNNSKDKENIIMTSQQSHQRQLLTFNKKNYQMSDNLQIADIMAMQIPRPNDFLKQIMLLKQFQKNYQAQNPKIVLNTIQKMILYISIGCFTRATQTFYMKKYTQKFYHVKAIKIASYIFSKNSSYLQFLLSTISDHFGKHLKQIQEEQQHSTSLISQLKRKMPKDAKQVSLVNIIFAQQ